MSTTPRSSISNTSSVNNEGKTPLLASTLTAAVPLKTSLSSSFGPTAATATTEETKEHSYYPKPRAKKFIYELLSIQDKDDHERSRDLIGEIERMLEFKNCLPGIGLGRVKNCKTKGCTIKNPCPSLDRNTIHSLLDDKDCNGICKNCGLYLSLWDEENFNSKKSLLSPNSSANNKINCFQIFKFDSTTCITKEDIKNKQVHILCNGCKNFAQIFYSDPQLFSLFSSIVFKRYPVPSTGVDSLYFPRLESINEDNQFISVTIGTKIGAKSSFTRKWLQQEGFVTYALPPNVEIDMKRYESNYQERYKRLNDKNEHVSKTSYFDQEDINIKSKKKPKKPSSATTTTVSKIVKEEDLYRNRWGFLVFGGIPIDPRRSVQKTKLDSLAYVPISPLNELSDSNYLMTTKYLATLQKRFDYEDFIRWGLDTFRRATPRFKKGGKWCSKSSLLEQDFKKLEEYKNLCLRILTLSDEKEEVQKAVQDLNEQKRTIFNQIRSRCLSTLESNDEAGKKLLAKYNLEAKIDGKRQERKTITKEYLAKILPDLLREYKILSKQEASTEELKNKCALMITQLYKETDKKSDSKLDKAYAQKTFSLVYRDPERSKDTNEKRTNSNSQYHEKKRKIKELKEEEERKERKTAENELLSKRSKLNMDADID